MKSTTSMLAAIIALTGSSQAALFLDDFSTDTSGDYVTTTTYGSGSPTHNVTGGTLNLVGAGGTTHVVMHKTARLEIGETLSVDLGASTTNLYLSISNVLNGADPTGPNAGDGLRVQWNGGVRGRTYNGGAQVNGTASAAVTPGMLWISRDTDTSYSFGYDAVTHDTVTLAGTAGQDLYIGVEGWATGTRSFDNLQITAVPEPSSAALIGLGGIALILRRRK